jgi:hypothetical protein
MMITNSGLWLKLNGSLETEVKKAIGGKKNE